MVIFDWDGTLCDSVDQIVAAMQGAALEVGVIPPAPADVRDIVGLGLPQAVAILYPELPADPRAAVTAAYSRHYVAAEGPISLFDGAMETLLTLRERGLPLAVATGKSRRGLNRVLGSLGLEDFFDVTRCADETRSKPHPRMLLEIMAASGRTAAEMFMVGDTEYDLDMARRAGMHPIGVSFGVHSPERLAAYQPLAIVDRLPQLLELEALGGAGREFPH